jgi:very-short-patch-repair endonuclease
MRPGQRPDFARAFRAELTEPERRLWARLRRRQIEGLHFRRQMPIGPYIVDFACGEHRLVVEVDGDTHADTQAYDDARSTYLEQRGWRVLRFWNNDVTGNVDGVIGRILEALQSPLPNPPPQAGEGKMQS